MNRLFLQLCLLVPVICFGKGIGTVSDLNEPVGELSPLLTGPLFAPTPYITEKGHINVEPYFAAVAYTGAYNTHWDVVDIPTYWTLQSSTFIQIGMSFWFDIVVSPTFYWNYCQHNGNWAIGDLPVMIEFQLFKHTFDGWFPSVKFGVQEIIPIGKYQNFDPQKKETQLGGYGSWNTVFSCPYGEHA